MTTYPSTPELEKMLAAREKSQVIGEFLEWMWSEKGYRIGSFRYQSGNPSEHLQLVYFNTNELLAEFFKIDLGKVEEERSAIMTFVRSTS